ncbi:MAG: amino acid permease [Acidobacteriota bacterium]
MRLFRTKSIGQIQADAERGFSEHGGTGGGMTRTLGQFDLTLMGVAAIIGAGIFAMVGKASYNGGPAVMFLFIFTAIACAFSALCYAEFASRIPVAGSAYTYSYASLGELVAWIIGWDLIVEYAIGNIAVAISWSDYFTEMLKGFHIFVPSSFTMDFLTAKRGFAAVNEALATGLPIESLQQNCALPDATITCGQLDAHQAWASAPQIGNFKFVADVPALMITFLITGLVYIGIRESKLAGNVMTVLKLAVILLVIVLGAFYVTPSNWSPFAPNGLKGVMMGVSAVFFAYIGFDALSTTAEECKNPQRDLPRAMIYSLIICTILYCLLALILTGMVPYTKLNVGDPLAFVFGAEGANIGWVAGVIAISAVIALATVFLVFQIGQPRLWMAISRDGLLPKRFAALHPKFKTPSFSTIITGLVVAIPALFMNLTEVTDLASIGTLFAFAIVCAGVLFKDKEFGKENRYVPYIDGSLLLPILLLALTGVIWFFNPDFVKDLVTITPQEGETFSRALSHKIPIFVFIGLTIVVTFFTIAKRLTLIPVLGLLLCSYLMTELGITNWLRFAVWLLIGLAVYFGYSVTHSNLAGQGSAKRTTSLYLRMASVGFLAAALGLAVSAFTFVADFVTYLLPGISVDTIYLFELGFSVFGLVFGAVGVIFEKTNSTAVTNR